RRGGDLAVLVVAVQRRVLQRFGQFVLGVVADVLGEHVGGQPVDVVLGLVVGVERLLRDRVEVLVGDLLGVEREPVGQPLVGQRQRFGRVVVLDAARLLHGAARVGVVGDRLGGGAVEGHGVDDRQQQPGVLLAVGAAHRAAHLQGDDV